MSQRRWEEDDLVTLAEFVEAVYSDELGPARRAAPSDPPPDAIEGRLSALRMLRRNNPAGFPDPQGQSSRAARYRMGDLVAWWMHQRRRAGPAEIAPDEIWTLRRAVDSAVQQLSAVSSFRPSLEGAFSPAAGESEDPRREVSNATRAVAALTLLDLDAAGLREPSRVLKSLSSARPPSLGRLPEPARRAAIRLREYARLGPAPSSRQPRPERLVEALVEARAAGWRAGRLLDEVLHATVAPAPYGKGTSTGPSLAAVIAAVALGYGRGEQPLSVVDLAAGEGSLLLALGRRADRPIEMQGLEIDPFAASLATARLYLEGRRDAWVEEGNSLTRRLERRADVVLLDPPLSRSGDLTIWLTRAIDAVAPGGHAVVVVPRGTRELGGEEWSEIGARHASAVVLLPARLREDAGEPLELWVLEPEVRNAPVRALDASDIGTRRSSGQVLDEDDIQAIAFAAASGHPLPSGRRVLSVADRTVPSEQIAAVGRADSFDVGSTLFDVSAMAAAPALDEAALEEALELALRLEDLVEGPLRQAVTAEQSRAVARLVANLSDRAGHPPRPRSRRRRPD